MLNIYLLFWLYAVLGWVMETALVSIQSKRFVNRGFLMGPYCPIYGTGGVLLLSLDPYKNSPFLVFILAIIICSIVEYLTSYILEIIYKVRWWDYSDRLFNIKGRICLFNSICFGLLGMLMVSFLNPIFMGLINKIPRNILIVISLVILIITLIDITITISCMFNIRKTIVNLKDKTLTNIFKKNQDATEEISKKIKNMLKEKDFISKHLQDAFSNMKVNRNNIVRKTEKILKLERIETITIISSIISIIIGYLIGSLINKKGLLICLFFVLNLIILRLITRRKNG